MNELSGQAGSTNVQLPGVDQFSVSVSIEFFTV